MSGLTPSFATARTLGLSAVIAAALALPATAQPANAPAGTTGNPPAQSETVPHAPASGAAHRLPPPQEMAQQRLKRLHDQLRITPAEQEAWDKFAEASTQSSDRIATAFRTRADRVASMNAVQNMQSFADIETQRAQDMQGLIPAFQQLYAALSPTQQKTADDLFRNATERHHTHAAKRHH